MELLDMVLRLGLAMAGGLMLGLDRELRGFSAGIRTHAMVGVSSALITMSAIMLYAEAQAAHDSTQLDPLRAIQGIAQAIGFIAAGVIFVSGGGVHNLTTAANLWLAAGLGIAAGAGQFELAFVALGFGLFLLAILRLFERYIPGSDKAESD